MARKGLTKTSHNVLWNCHISCIMAEHRLLMLFKCYDQFICQPEDIEIMINYAKKIHHLFKPLNFVQVLQYVVQVTLTPMKSVVLTYN